MRIYEALGTEEHVFDASELWDDDEDILNSDGEELRAFINSYPEGTLSFDATNVAGEGKRLQETLELYFNESNRRHSIPIDQEWLNHFAHFCCRYYRDGDLEQAAMHYRIYQGDSFEDARENYDTDGLMYFAEADLNSAREQAGKNYAENHAWNYDDNTVDYIDWSQIGIDNCTFLKYDGSYIVLEDDYA